MTEPFTASHTQQSRWLGIELGKLSYAVELSLVSAVYYDAQASTEHTDYSHRPFLNLQGLTIKDGKPVFLMSAADLFEADEGIQFGQDTFGVSTQHSPWVVVFSVEVDGALLGIRVDRTSGPFRASVSQDQGENLHMFVRLKQEYLDSLKRDNL